MELKNKIDFALIISAEKCNPNGDPLNLNKPRQDYEGFGLMSQECLKRKIRNRLQDMGECIFVQDNARTDDGCTSLFERAHKYTAFYKEILKKKNADPELCKKLACKKWFDVRAFGQVFSFKGYESSIGIKGPVSITEARTLKEIFIEEKAITKSVNMISMIGKDNTTFGKKYAIDKGAYVATGSIFPQLAAKTGFSMEDGEKVKESLKTILENDASAYRPSGSMSSFLYWWKHDCPNGRTGTARVVRSLHVQSSEEWPFFTVSPEEIPGVKLEIY